MNLSRADVEFYHAARVRQMCLELSKRDAASWQALSYRTKRKWLDLAVDTVYQELLDMCGE